MSAHAVPLVPREEAVQFANAATTLAGTLLLPPGPGPHAGVLLVPGSGPVDRDGTIAGFQPFRVLAERLAPRVAVLRYDHRGAGASSGDALEATTAELTGDAAAAHRFLCAHPQIDPRRVVVLGHSEGAVVAAWVAVQTTVAGLVLLAPPAIGGDDLLRAQAERVARACGASEDEVAHCLALLEDMMRCARTGTGWDAAREAVRRDFERDVAALDEAQREQLGDVDRFVESRVASTLHLAQSRWYRAFLELDPAPLFAAVRCPVLALFGEVDLQVPPDRNLPPFDTAMAHNPDARCITVSSANHLFQNAATGSPREYATLEPAFAPDVPGTIADWIVSRTARGG